MPVVPLLIPAHILSKLYRFSSAVLLVYILRESIARILSKLNFIRPLLSYCFTFYVVHFTRSYYILPYLGFS